MLLIEKAYLAGKNIKKAILDNNGDIKLATLKIQEMKGNKHNLSYEYLKLCLDYNVKNDNSFMVDMLADDVDVSSEEVGLSLALGLMSEEDEAEEYDKDWITLKEAAELWGKSSSTLRRVIKGKNFKEEFDYKKEGRDWHIKRSAMERVYGQIDNN